MPWQSEIPRKAGASTPAFSCQDHDLGPPDYTLRIWPHQSGQLSDLRTALAVVAIGLFLPLLALAGSKVGWTLLPFMIAALAALYFAFRANIHRAQTLSDMLCLWHDTLRVSHTSPQGKVATWEANPYWVSVTLHKNARLEHYLTLSGEGREIELGAFLSPEERLSLYNEVCDALTACKARRL
ncbi:DUF2244 domain-containing protein [Halovulum sp. GXIMD14793]